MKTLKLVIITLLFLPHLLLRAGNYEYSALTYKLIPPPPPCGLPVSIIKDLKTDFGAVGDGITDDSQAFLNATDWINTNWSNSFAIKLFIPAGNYLVGKQLRRGETWNYGTGSISNPTSGINYLGVDMLKLTGAKNVIIEGAAGLTSKIIYKDKLAFGGLTSADVPCVAATSCNTCPGGGADIATVGIFLNLDLCSCITVSNLWIEGHANSSFLGGGVGECGSRQLAYDGIVIWGGSDITIANTVAANFGRDGLMTLYKSGNPVNITLNNFISSCNSRQGFSFTAGDNIVATDCQFNLTGPVPSGCAFSSNPMAGLDVEPESGGTCINSSFTRCSFGNNYNYGLISDNQYPNVTNFGFDSCFFSGRSNPSNSGYALWPMRMINTKFSRCVILGQMLHVAGTSVSDHMLFQKCLLSDYFVSLDWPLSCWNRYMLDFGSGPPDDIFYTFDQCEVRLHHSMFSYMAPSQPTYAHTARVFNKNNFELTYEHMVASGGGFSGVSGQSIGHFKNCKLSGNTFIDRKPEFNKPPGYWIGVDTPGNPNGYNTSDGLNTFMPNGISLYGHVGYNPNYGASNRKYFGNW